WRTRHSQLLGSSTLHIVFFYVQRFISNNLGWCFGVLLLRASFPRSFGNRLIILRLGKDKCGKHRGRENHRQSKAQVNVARHRTTPRVNLSGLNFQDTPAAWESQCELFMRRERANGVREYRRARHSELILDYGTIRELVSGAQPRILLPKRREKKSVSAGLSPACRSSLHKDK